MDGINLRMNLAEMACEQLIPHVIRLMNSPIESIRASAFGFALDIIGQRPQEPSTFQTRSQLKEAYINRIQSSDLDVARQAITFLPDFVNMCIAYSLANADELIAVAVHCVTSRNVLNDVNDYIVYAMKVFGQLNDEDSRSTDSKKEAKKRSREDGEIN
ncbi:unnamed protein product [Angiostrongylus costaricensis]|uniref:Adaptin_N domain-containing protein n=1 Tax=Angiostrongylus costaricensis TaxID=334426 RepID=A0A0R3PY77_ANGCS|nr:unnamed protein product [Angiostrongylus costaricensis]